MFWNTLAVEEREIDRKLKSENIDFKSILDDMHCLQEIRNSNEQLINFFKRDDNFRTLVNAIVVPPDLENENQIKSRNDRESYKFIHQCCEALCIGIREFYPVFEKHEDLQQKVANYLPDNLQHLNPLLISFYSRMVISFLSIEPDKFLDILEKSNFLEGCIAGLENCSLFELLSTIPNCMPDPVFRERIKKWYIEKCFVERLLDLLSPNQPPSIHENAAALWVEFVKGLREFQYNVEQSADPLLESIQSEESVSKLLDLMFPSDGREFSKSVVANGALILNALLETNLIANSPSQLLMQESQGLNNNTSLLDQQPNFSFNSDNNSNISLQLLMDPKRIVETRCAEHSADILSCVLHSLNDDSEFSGDILNNCMQLLINLTNTNFLPTHLELLRAFSAPNTSFSLLMEQVADNSSRSIFNAQLVTIILHILYSNTGTTQHPLIDFIIRDFNLSGFIMNTLPDTIWNEDFVMTFDKSAPLSNRLYTVAKRSFFLHLANRLLQSQQTSPNSEYIGELMKELPNYDKWLEFCSNPVQSFIDQNRSEIINSISSTNRTYNAIEIDELPDDNILTLSHITSLSLTQ